MGGALSEMSWVIARGLYLTLSTIAAKASG